MSPRVSDGKAVLPARGRTQREQYRCSARRSLEDCEIGPNDGGRAFENLRPGAGARSTRGSRSARRCRSSCSPLASRLGAQGIVARGDPPNPHPGERERLRHHAEADGDGRAFGTGWQAFRAVLQEPVHFVAEQMRAVQLGDVDQSREVAGGSWAPVGLCGKLMTTTRVLGRIAAATASTSSDQSRGSSGTSVTFAPIDRATSCND